jgi:dolichol-phosphate mannosyltransferase
MKLSIIIPLFNEKNTIVKLLSLIEEQTQIDKQIIIVNDCSEDSSLDLVNNFKFLSEYLILSHYKNLGKGACIKTAQKHIKGDIVLIQDADLEYRPSDYYKLIAPIVNNKTNVVYGSRVLLRSRYANNNFTSFIRIFINHILTIMSNVLNNQKLTDAHTCYKVCKKSIFKKINLAENGFAFCPEFTSKISNLGEEIIEVPIDYFGRSYAEGKKIKSIDGIKAVTALIKYGLLKRNK